MVWEIPGHLKNVDYSFRYCLGSTFVIYVFDMSDRKSVTDLKDWVKETEFCDCSWVTSQPVHGRQQIGLGVRGRQEGGN